MSKVRLDTKTAFVLPSMPCASAYVPWLGHRQHVWQLSFLSLRLSAGKPITLSMLNPLSHRHRHEQRCCEMIMSFRRIMVLTQLKVIQCLPSPLCCSPCQICRLSPRTCCPLHLSALPTTCSCPKSRAAAPAAKTPPVTLMTLCWCPISLENSPVSHIMSPNTCHAPRQTTATLLYTIYTAKII